MAGSVAGMDAETRERRALRAAIEDFEAGGCRVDRVVVSICECGSETFAVVFDDEVGVAARICVACGDEAGLADSDEHLDDVESVVQAECRCGNAEFRVAVGYALTAGEVRWASIGLRCTRDGLAGVYVDWKIDYQPTAHLLRGA